MTPRRFYKTVTITESLGIALDGREVKTPLKVLLRLPSRDLAEAVAGEWRSQGDRIDPATMVLTRLANTAIDRVRPAREAILGEILDFAGSDLVCYRADIPMDLVTRQRRSWDPVIDWARTVLDAPMQTHVGVIHHAQPDAAIAAIRQAAAALDDFQLAAFHTAMTLTGSCLIALMIARAALTPEAGWAAAHVDEDFQIEHWGQDAEAAARRQARQSEFLSSCRFMELARH